jgi:hypothetical protein
VARYALGHLADAHLSRPFLCVADHAAINLVEASAVSEGGAVTWFGSLDWIWREREEGDAEFGSVRERVRGFVVSA